MLQTILPPLLTAGGRTVVTLEGGRTTPGRPRSISWSACFCPSSIALVLASRSALERHGFYPAGGGRFSVTIDPSPELARLELCDRGEIVGRRFDRWSHTCRGTSENERWPPRAGC